MIVLKTPQSYKNWRKSITKTIGFVPTMGALHDGHKELLKIAKRDNDIVVLSIFVNPTQFNDKNDFNNYPNSLNEDLEIARQIGVDAVFCPQFEDIYPDNYKFTVIENENSKILCGKSRQGHFDGVLTIVLKLFNIIAPQKAYFGEKDFQQLQLIKNMVEAFFLPIEIVPVAIVREKSGLALSSRNVHLNEAGQKIAPKIFEIISNTKNLEIAKNELINLNFEIDYLEEHWGRRFVAVKTNLTKNGNILRLIDNVKI